jgi:integrase/recombinase XerC
MRHSKLWFRKFTGTYYTQVNGERHNLGPNKAKATARFHALMAGVDGIDPKASIKVLFDKFLAYAGEHNEPSTVEYYKRYIDSFLAKHKTLKVAKLKVHHVTEWLDANGWQGTTRGCAIRAIKRPFQWAADEGHISASPIKTVKRVKTTRREVVISPAQWQQILDAASDDAFRDFLLFIRETGARPQESRQVEARHFDEVNGRICWSGAEAPKGEVARTIYLTPDALALVKRLAEKNPAGALLRNSQGKAWTKNAIVCRFRRVREKTGLEGLVCYTMRHTFGTELLVNGVDSVVGAELMGHADRTQLANTYAKLAQNPQFLREAAKKARGG